MQLWIYLARQTSLTTIGTYQQKPKAFLGYEYRQNITFRYNELVKGPYQEHMEKWLKEESKNRTRGTEI